MNAHRTMYSDQTGRFPMQSNRGNKLLMVAYDVDSNYIDAEPAHDSNQRSLITAYQALWQRITKNASESEKPQMHIIDNEASQAFKDEIRKNCALQLAPPDTHRCNLAERAIQTFKSHFIAILAGVDSSFPMQLWDRLIPQAVLTLNLLRQSHTNPSISAYEHVNEKFDYNAMPLGPMGCAVQIHEGPQKRLTWAAHTTDGWYLRTSPEHYRCHVVYVKKTRAERVSDRVLFQHKYITNPEITPTDKLIVALTDFTTAIERKSNADVQQQVAGLEKYVEVTQPNDGKHNGHKKKVTFDLPLVSSPLIVTRTSATTPD